MKDLRGRCAIVTGASRGIGPYIARALAAKGVRLVLAARSRERLDKAAAMLAARGAEVLAVPADVSIADDRRALVAAAIERFGAVDILVNNAGIGFGASFASYPPERLREVIEVNLLAAMFLTREVLPSMLERRSGHIVNVSSLAGKFPVPFNAVYSASKAGLIGFSQSLRAELEDTGVGVSCVSPGLVSKVGMWAESSKRGTGLAEKLGRTSSPARVARAVVRAIERDQVDVIVNPVPMRPIAVFREAAPGAILKLLALSGVTRSMSEVDRRPPRKAV